MELTRPDDGGTMWRHAWVNAVDRFDERWPEPYRLIHDRGVGMLIQGTREWRDYEVSADITPRLAASAGIAARVQGVARLPAALTDRSAVQLVRMHDGRPCSPRRTTRDFYRTYELTFGCRDPRPRPVGRPPRGGRRRRYSRLRDGAASLTIHEGHMVTHSVRVTPLAHPTTRSTYQQGMR